MIQAQRIIANNPTTIYSIETLHPLLAILLSAESLGSWTIEL